MRALVIARPGTAYVEDVAPPIPGSGEVLVDIRSAAICGTDLELFDGAMHPTRARLVHYPVRAGREWAGVVRSVGAGVSPDWVGARVVGESMIGCRTCDRCQSGRHWLCRNATDISTQGTRPGALAEQIAVPVQALHRLPGSVDDIRGSMVEPGGAAWRAVSDSGVQAGEQVLILGAQALGLLVALFARATGIDTHILEPDHGRAAFARSLDFPCSTEESTLPVREWNAVIDVSNTADLPAVALRLVEPGRTFVQLGLSGPASRVDARAIVLNDLTAVGIASATAGFVPAIEQYASGVVDPGVLVRETTSLAQVPALLAQWPTAAAALAPKVVVELPHTAA